MTNKRILTLITLLLFLFLLVGCDWLTPNRPPEIKSVPVTTATLGLDYTYNVVATDPDGNALTYSLTTEPDGMLIGVGSGKITWKADDITAAGVGDYDVVVVVSDEGGLFDIQDFTITVSEFVVELIGIEAEPKEMILTDVSDPETFKVTADYNDDSTTDVTLECVYGIDDISIAKVEDGKVTALKVGTATISISYTEEGITKETTIPVIVEGTIIISWWEAAIRFNPDDTVHSDWTDDPNGPATLILTGGEYHFADVAEFYNVAPENRDQYNFEGSVIIDETGLLSGNTTYTLHELPTVNDFAGQVKIIIYDGVVDGNDGTMVGTCTQLKYALGTEESVQAKYPLATIEYVGSVDGVDKWFVQYTEYIFHLPPLS